MTGPTLIDMARRPTVAEGKRKHRWVKKKDWNPGGKKGKLHRELGIPEDETIPKERLEQATRSRNPEIRRDAIRAETMEHWHHGKAHRRYSRPKASVAHRIGA